MTVRDGYMPAMVAAVCAAFTLAAGAEVSTAAKADAVSPVVTHSLDATVARSLGEKLPATMRGGTWKVVYSSAEGPEGRALEVLTKRAGTYFLREAHFATPFVLPLEKDGGEVVDTKRDAFVIGVPERNATLRALLGEKKVPAGGYLIKTMRRNGRNVVVIAGDELEKGVVKLRDMEKSEETEVPAGEIVERIANR